MARWRIAWLLILVTALALAVAGVRPAHGKGDAWVITGGELGDYATVIAFERDAPRTEALPESMRPPAETPYGLYSANGLFTTAAGFAEAPILRYYPKAHVVESLNAEWMTPRWTRLAPKDGQPGKFWAEGPGASGASPYYAATPGLDAFIADAMARHDARGAVSTGGESLRASVSSAGKRIHGDAAAASPAVASARAEAGPELSTAVRAALVAFSVFLAAGVGRAMYVSTRRMGRRSR